MANYKKNLDFWTNLQNFVMADFTKLSFKLLNSNK